MRDTEKKRGTDKENERYREGQIEKMRDIEKERSR
jgi:hypothetical protein